MDLALVNSNAVFVEFYFRIFGI